MVQPTDLFSAPIPGESLTRTKGSSPYEKPPRYTNLNEVLQYSWDKMSSVKGQAMIVAMIKAGAPIDAINNTVLFEGAAKGYFSFDMALSAGLTTHKMIASIAYKAIANGNLKAEDITLFSRDKDMESFMDNFSDNQLESNPAVEESPVAEEQDEEILGGML